MDRQDGNNCWRARQQFRRIRDRHRHHSLRNRQSVWHSYETCWSRFPGRRADGVVDVIGRRLDCQWSRRIHETAHMAANRRWLVSAFGPGCTGRENHPRRQRSDYSPARQQRRRRSRFLRMPDQRLSHHRRTRFRHLAAAGRSRSPLLGDRIARLRTDSA